MVRILLALTIGVTLVTHVQAQSAAPPILQYGEPIKLADAKRVLDAAEKLAAKENWPVAIAVVDPGGYLVAFIKLDQTQLGSVDVAMQKAKTAAIYRRSTKELEDRIAQGGVNLKLLTLPGLPMEGGLPLMVDGKVVGAIGVSGVQSSQDGQVAAGGAAILSPTKK